MESGHFESKYVSGQYNNNTLDSPYEKTAVLALPANCDLSWKPLENTPHESQSNQSFVQPPGQPDAHIFHETIRHLPEVPAMGRGARCFVSLP
jgi:hypothetical protein